MEATINITSEIGVVTTFMDVLTAIHENKEATAYAFVIDSEGGYVDEGFRIARLIEGLDKPTRTVAVRVASIANVIFLASENRSAVKGAEFMVHMASFQPPAGNADDLRAWAEMLDREDTKIRSYLAEKTGMSDMQIAEAMKHDTYINENQARALGFFNAVNRLRCVAKFVSKTNENMADDKEARSLLKQIRDMLGFKVDAKNVEITLEDGDSIMVESDDGELEGKPTNAPNGTHKLKDGRSITVADGVVTSVQEASAEDAEGETPESDAPSLEDENAMLREKLAKAMQELEGMKTDVEDKEQATNKMLDEMKGELFAIKNFISSNATAVNKLPKFMQTAHNVGREALTDKEKLSAKAKEVLADKLAKFAEVNVSDREFNKRLAKNAKIQNFK